MKTYKIKFDKNGQTINKEVESIKCLNKILNGDACNCTVLTRISEDMPLKMHNRISTHNKKILV